VDALAGGALALVLITVANAALPRVQRTEPARPAAASLLLRPTIAAARSPAKPQPAALIAFRSPEPGYPIISPFGLRQLPWEESGRLHAGVDIAAPAGDPVLAAADGVVTRMAVDPGYGRFVEVEHAAGLSTRYGHLSRYAARVQPGVAVKAGETLGAVGSTGSSTGSHLHFEIRDQDGRPMNPELFLGRSFATAADLPLREAGRMPRGVRVAYVSNIPTSKRGAMQSKLELAGSPDAMYLGAADISLDGLDGGTGPVRRVHGRPHARFRPHTGG
jgi:murein DD-endopeptidase MepM/ murein hydrolase activator NlpD